MLFQIINIGNIPTSDNHIKNDVISNSNVTHRQLLQFLLPFGEAISEWFPKLQQMPLILPTTENKFTNFNKFVLGTL